MMITRMIREDPSQNVRWAALSSRSLFERYHTHRCSSVMKREPRVVQETRSRLRHCLAVATLMVIGILAVESASLAHQTKAGVGQATEGPGIQTPATRGADERRPGQSDLSAA